MTKQELIEMTGSEEQAAYAMEILLKNCKAPFVKMAIQAELKAIDEEIEALRKDGILYEVNHSFSVNWGKAHEVFGDEPGAFWSATEEQKQETEGQKVVETITISSPITGLAADLSTAPDEAFAQKMMGDGAVVTPEDPYVRAPEDGEVAFVFDTKHAIGFVTDSGISLLIHVGIDTVKLNGEGFEALVESGQTVKKGEPMLKLDLDYLKEHAPSVTSPVLCTELEDNQRIRLLKDGPVKAGEPLFEIEVLQ